MYLHHFDIYLKIKKKIIVRVKKADTLTLLRGNFVF